MTRCDDVRTQMIAFVRGELRALEYARIESHLERCAQCGAAEKKLREGLGAAAKYAPKLDPEHLERLVRRLAPYVEQARPQPLLPRFVVATGFAAAAIAAAIAVFFTGGPEPAVVAPPIEVAAAPEPAAPVEPVASIAPVGHVAPPAPVVKQGVTPHLRVVASADWNGKTIEKDRKTSVDMDRGFAVMAFEGGDGRVLAVETPEVSVEAIGSKFFVSVVKPGLTTIGVVSGRVKVKTPAGVEDLEAGRTRAWSRDGAPAKEVPATSIPEVNFDDEFLAQKPVEVARAEPRPHEETPAEASTRRARETAPIALAPVDLPTPSPDASASEETPAIEAAPDAGPPPPAVDIYAELARAEHLTHSGRAPEALRAYEALLEHDAHRALVRYEIARLQGFHLGDVSAARETFTSLAVQEDSEVGTQAALAICELDLAHDRCAARACLQKLSESAAKSSVRREAKELMRRWGIEKIDCR